MSTAGVRLAPQRNGAKESGLARFGPAQASGMHVRKKRRPAPVGMTEKIESDRMTAKEMTPD